MWLIEPEQDNDLGCYGDCNCYIKFSDPFITPIKIKTCIGGFPKNKGDLNKNGSDEISLIPDWFTSCWDLCYVWTYINGKWVYAVDPITVHCNQIEEGINPIEIDKARYGYVTIRYSDIDIDTFKIKTKSVKIVK